MKPSIKLCLKKVLPWGGFGGGGPEREGEGGKNGLGTLSEGETGRSLLHKKSNQDNKKGGDNADEESLSLKRHFGMIGGICLVAGNMVGSGIFISPSGVVAGAGSVGLSLLVWALSGIVALMGGLCFAELGTMIPESGAEYSYILRALGDLPAFLFAWISNLLINPASVAITSLACGHYIIAMVYEGDCDEPRDLQVKLLTTVIIVLLAAINCISVRLVNRLSVMLTTAKFIALFCIICGGAFKLAQGHTEYLASGFEGTTGNPGLLATSFYNGLWAYDGWKQLTCITEELENPNRNLPIANTVGVSLVVVVYVITNVAYFTVMSPSDIIMSPAVAVTWADRVVPSLRWTVFVAVVVSTFGCALGSMCSFSRLNFVSARQGHTAHVMSMVNTNCFTPVPAVIFMTLMSLLTVYVGDLASLIDYFSFTAWLFYGLCCFIVVLMRYQAPDLVRPYKVPLPIAIVMTVISMGLVVLPIALHPQVEYLFSAVLIFVGMLAYLPLVRYELRPPGMDRFTKTCQILLNVAPPSDIQKMKLSD